jgi:hypothetical protein
MPPVNRIEILQGRWQHGEKVGYCYHSGLEKTLCKWDIYVPLVTKGLIYCALLCSVTDLGNGGVNIIYVHFWSRKIPEASELTLLHQSAVHIPQAIIQSVESALNIVPVEVFVVRAVTVEVV